METIALDDPRVQKVRARFEKVRDWHRNQLKSKIGFKEYLDFFSGDCNSFSQIGRIAGGISREAVRLLYEKYFKRLAPGRKSGRLRRRVCTLKRYAVAAKELPHNPIAREIALIAQAAGCTVEQLRKYKSNYFHFLTRALQINNRKCFLVSRRSHQRKSNYSHFSVQVSTLKKYDFLILLQCVPDCPQRIFVVPTSVLLDHNKSVFDYVKNIAIPVAKFYRRRPKINFLRYENAWVLIKA